jgi:V8-like Glu-specific endopeptidase/endonuclease/exonuclease/phosphatase family metal-dependent hydrolase/lysophospholipase L1-like esterase
MAKKITLNELRELLRQTQPDESQLRKYLKTDYDLSRAFAPEVTIDTDKVDTEGLEAAIALGLLNGFSRRWRQNRYHTMIDDGWPGPRIVSEGDSWFQYPVILEDIVDQLFGEFAVYSLGAGGDLLADMIEEDELSEAIDEQKPDLFMISGGGNDVIGGGMLIKILRPFEEGRAPQDYLNADFESVMGEISRLYKHVFAKLAGDFPNLPILCHGYDHAIPNDGKWLGKPMKELKITKRKLQRQIIEVIIDRFNESLKAIASEFPGVVHFVDCRGAVPDDEWYDELHPTSEGYARVADRFRTVIQSFASTHETSRWRGAPLSPGREMAVANVKDLGEEEFRCLVGRRARILSRRDIGPVETETDRQELEKEISQHFEKVHRGADFLPAQFLTDGAMRAEAVCRIRTSTSYGTGFLVADHGFVMTNNHVIGDRDTAASSVAEFGFEQSGSATNVALEPDRFFVTDKELDFTIIGCDGASLTNLTPIPFLRNPATVTRNDRVNIVQHPRGRPKEIAIHDNKVTRLMDKVVRYSTDTEPGSSGSPVFNNQWDLVALHHAGWPDGDGAATNEGIRLAAIVGRLLRRSRESNEDSEGLERILGHIPDSSPLLGFFDVDGVEGDDLLEIEVPDFQGKPDFADIGFWNIEHFNAQISDERVERVADVLDRMSMDAMGLVEVEEPALRRLVDALQRRGNTIGYEVLDVSGRQDLAILYDRETTKVARADDIHRRYRSDLAVTTSSGRRAFPREPLFALCTIEDNANPIEFLMIVVHLKAFGDAQSRARRRLASEILARIIADVRERDNIPVVLGGDFNDAINTDVLSALRDSADLFALTLDDASAGAASYVGARHKSLIDHIVISRDVRPGDIAGDDAAIVRLDRSVGDFASAVSDHTPIVMRIVSRANPVSIDPEPRETDRAAVPVPSGASEVILSFD